MLYSMNMEVREQLRVSCCFYTLDPGIPLSEGLQQRLILVSFSAWQKTLDSQELFSAVHSHLNSHMILPALGKHFAGKRDFSFPSLLSKHIQILRSSYSLHLTFIITSALNSFITGSVSLVPFATIIYYDNHDQKCPN